MTQDFPTSALLHLPDAVISIDRTSTILFVNHAAARLFGYPREEFVGRTLMDTVIPSQLAQQHRSGMERFFASGHGPVIGRRIEISARDRAGRVFPIDLCVYIDPDRVGEVFHAMIREVSDRVATEASARAEHDRLRQFLDASADAWWDLRVGAGTTYSAGAVAVIGRAADGQIAHDPAHAPWIHPRDRERVVDQWTAHLSGATARYECTYRVVGGVAGAGDAAERWVRDRGRAVEFADGRPVRIIGTVVDVTEQHDAEERLHNAKRLEMLGVLAGGFAHDLNNLLAAIRGQAAMLALEGGASPSTVEALESIQLATTKAKMLTSNMLSLGRPHQTDVRRFSLVAAVEDIVRIVRVGLSKSVVLSLDLAGARSLDLEMDPGAFQQAMLNLLLNARDAMPSGGSLRVSAVGAVDELGAQRARIVVEDSGAGIAPEHLPRIFEPFFTTKPKGVGTGLGLAVVAKAVSTAGGRVSVQSDLGHGTRFTLEFPAHVDAAVAPAEPAPLVGSLRVLLAEDHAMLRAMLGEVLRSQGHAVVECSSGAEALELAADASRPFDVHVLDVVLPSIDGPSVHRRGEAAHARTIPVVFLSGDPGSVVDLGAFQRAHLLAKPFDIVDFVAAVRTVMTAGTGR